MMQLSGQDLKPDGQKEMQSWRKEMRRGYKLGIISDVKLKIIHIPWFDEFINNCRAAEQLRWEKWL